MNLVFCSAFFFEVRLHKLFHLLAFIRENCREPVFIWIADIGHSVSLSNADSLQSIIFTMAFLSWVISVIKPSYLSIFSFGFCGNFFVVLSVSSL